jgi:hypothetical protein
MGSASRKPALQGQTVTPAAFPDTFFPGTTNPGTISTEQCFGVYSDGDMKDLWIINHVRDIENFGNR